MDKITAETVKALCGDDFGRGFDLARAIREHFGWSVRVLTQHDAANAYDGEGELSQEDWDKLRNSRAWADLSDMDDSDWDRVHVATYSVLGRRKVTS